MLKGFADSLSVDGEVTLFRRNILVDSKGKWTLWNAVELMVFDHDSVFILKLDVVHFHVDNESHDHIFAWIGKVLSVSSKRVESNSIRGSFIVKFE